MFGSGKKKNAAKKAYEMAYALFRISARIAEASVKEKLESYGIDLLVSVNTEEYGDAATAVAAIDALVKFAIDLNIISIANGDVLIREIGVINEALAECLDKSDEVDVSRFFSAPQEKRGSGMAKQNFDSVAPVVSRPFVAPVHIASIDLAEYPAPYRSAGQVPIRAQISPEMTDSDPMPSASMARLSGVGQQDEKNEKSSDVRSGNPASTIAKSGNRQIAILDRIRQSGNCKLRDIQEILPDCSERTIRYDLEELIERNLVERIGTGGPAVFYRIRQNSLAPKEAAIQK